MVEQIETLQIQLAELTTEQAMTSINYLASQPPQQQNYPSVYYAPETNWSLPLNRPYETTQP